MCGQAKEEWLNRQCQEVEELGRRDPRKVYAVIKEIAGNRKQERRTAIKVR